MSKLAIIFLISIPLISGQILDKIQVVDDQLRQPKPRCPGGYDEGVEVVRGRYWYQCHDGTLDPKGCISESGARIQVYGTVDSVDHAYRLQCFLDQHGDLSFQYQSCLYNGQEYKVNERWQDDKYIYTCVTEDDHLRMVVDGCIDNGKEIALNEKVKKGNFLYQCKRTENQGTCSMCPIGCVKSDREFLTGETIEDGHFWYTCSNEEGRLTLKGSGCLNGGQRLKDRDHYIRNDITYECQVTNDEVKEKVIGCAGRDDQGKSIEQPLGQSWTDGQYDVVCKYDEAADKMIKVKVKCNYKSANGVTSIDAGCYRIIDTAAIGCLKDTNNDLNVKVFRVDEIGLAPSQGLRFC